MSAAPSEHVVFGRGAKAVRLVVGPDGVGHVVDGDRTALPDTARAGVGLGGPDVPWLAVADMAHFALSRFPDVDPAQAVRTLAVSPDRRKALATAACVAGGPEWLMWALAYDPERLTRARVAADTTDPAMADWLAGDSDPFVVAAAAGNWCCPPATLAGLAGHPAATVQLRVAAHHASPAPALDAMAARAMAVPDAPCPPPAPWSAPNPGDIPPEHEVGCALAARVHGHLLAGALAAHPSPYVRMSAAGNVAATAAALAALAADDDPRVRAVAVDNPRLLRALVDAAELDPDPVVAAAATRRACLTPSALAGLARSGLPADRRAAARHSADPALLSVAAADRLAEVRLHAVNNPALPDSALPPRLRDRSLYVRGAAAARLRAAGALPQPA